MPNLTLSFHARGLVLAGETYALRELLKHRGGRWDTELRGWVFPFDGKRALLDAIQGSEDGRMLTVQDGAKARLILAAVEGGVQVGGETFPVKALLREEGGTWNPAVKVWTFRGRGRAELTKALRASPDVATIEDEEPIPATPPRPASQRGANAADGASATKALAKGRLRGKQPPSERHGDAAPQQLQTQRKDKLKVTEVGRSSSRAEQRADGSQAKTQEEKKERKLSCARTGAHVATESVTRKRKLEETRDKVVETRTIVIKRMRSKK